MTGLTDLVGILLNCGMISSGDARIVNAMGSSGLRKSSGLLLQTLGATHTGRSKINKNVKSSANILDFLINVVKNVLGQGRRNSYTRGVVRPASFGTLRGVLFNRRRSTPMKGSSLGGEAMALLLIMAFQAFKNINRQPVGMKEVISSSEILLGLRSPVNAEEVKELEITATLILKGMINAAKVGSHIGNEELQAIIWRIRKSDSSAEMQKLIFEEMQLPLNLDSMAKEIPNEAIAALVYAASLFAIEVDTLAEREYLEQFVQRTGLDSVVAQQLMSAVGVK